MRLRFCGHATKSGSQIALPADLLRWPLLYLPQSSLPSRLGQNSLTKIQLFAFRRWLRAFLGNSSRLCFNRFAKETDMVLTLTSQRLALCALLLLAATGCVRRRLTVRTNPPGALVSVDNQIIGTSPAASPYVYYGTREVRVELDGYRTEVIRRRLDPPWYEYPPFDFITETLWPLEVRDERIIDVELVPQEVATIETVLDRANTLRDQSRQGVVPAAANISVPLPNGPATTNRLVPPPSGQQLPPGGFTLE